MRILNISGKHICGDCSDFSDLIIENWTMVFSMTTETYMYSL